MANIFSTKSAIPATVNAPTLHKKASKEVLGISLLQNSTESTTIPTGPSVFHTTTYIPTVQPTADAKQGLFHAPVNYK